MINKNLLNHFVLDVEADGPVPGIYSMVSFALVCVGNLDVSFYSELAPITESYQEEALAVCNFTRQQTLTFNSAYKEMIRLQDFIQNNVTGRPIIWSDNNSFDYGFLRYYIIKFLKADILGYSSRRIGDYCAGLSGNPRDVKKWKKFVTIKHTHNALDDAKGNAQGLQHLLTYGL